MHTETVRTDLMIIGKAIEEYDQVVGALAKGRYQYEMLSRNPEGVPPKMKLDDFRQNVFDLINETDAAAEIAQHLSGASSITEARLTHMRLLVAYQNVQHLNELLERKLAGDVSVFEELTKANIQGEQELRTSLANAEKHLESVAKTAQVPDMARLTVVSGPSTFNLK